jgi:hypothetical protein
MNNQSSDEDEFIDKPLRSSINFSHTNRLLSFEEEKKEYRKRSSSMSLNMPKDFVPKLKPIKAVICPSPIKLNQKSPPAIPEKIVNMGVTCSKLYPPKDINLKPIKCIYLRRRNKKRSSKIIEEETHETEAISDCEDKPKKLDYIFSDSDDSINGDEDSLNKRKIKNIKILREKMMLIRKKSIYNDNIFDDSNIGSNFRLYQSSNICLNNRINKNNIDKIRSIKYRTKSFNIKQRYVPTILGFLEKNNSANSLNSTEK